MQYVYRDISSRLVVKVQFQSVRWSERTSYSHEEMNEEGQTGGYNGGEGGTIDSSLDGEFKSPCSHHMFTLALPAL